MQSVFECSGGGLSESGCCRCAIVSCVWMRVFITGEWKCRGDALVSMLYILVYYKKTPPELSFILTKLHRVFPPSSFPSLHRKTQLWNSIFFSPSGVNLLPAITVQKVRCFVLQECMLKASEPTSLYLYFRERLLSIVWPCPDHSQCSDKLKRYNNSYALVCHCLKKKKKKSCMFTAQHTCVRNREVIHALMEHFPFPAHLEV